MPARWLTSTTLGGRVGAWVADVLLFVFGLSAYWWAVFLLRKVWRGWRQLTTEVVIERAEAPPGLSVTWFGFVAVAGQRHGTRAIRMYGMSMALPRAPGGVLGDLIGFSLQHALGFTGATLLLLLLILYQLSLFFHFSWLAVAEGVGGLVESLFVGFRLRRERKQDQRMAKSPRSSAKARSRSSVCASRRAPPVQIVRPAAVAKHERVEREKQQPLFTENLMFLMSFI